MAVIPHRLTNTAMAEGQGEVMTNPFLAMAVELRVRSALRARWSRLSHASTVTK